MALAPTVTELKDDAEQDKHRKARIIQYLVLNEIFTLTNEAGLVAMTDIESLDLAEKIEPLL